MNILVGCPVYRRDWILPQWFEHVEASCSAARVTPEFILLCDKKDPSRHVASAFCKITNRKLHYVDVIEKQDASRKDHPWSDEEALHRMVWIRNLLLEDVRELAPPYFLSLDSDILIAEPTVGQLLETIDVGHHAVGGLAYMAPGLDAPSWGSWSRNNGLSRKYAEGVFPVDIIMGIKLMSPAAYSIDYEFDREGEDIGWSMACKNAGLSLMWDGRTPNKHVMDKAQIDQVDRRCGY